MHADAPRRRRSLRAAVTAGALALLGAGLVFAGLGTGAGPVEPERTVAVASPRPTPSETDAPTTEATAESAPAAVEITAPSLPRSRPTVLDIPSIGVHSDEIVELAKEPDGTLEVPVDYAQPGWYTPGPAPGQFGPAVIAGHVDSKKGPAIFYRLGELKPGAEVTVKREDGKTARFVVDRVQRYPKDSFPTVEVYGDTTQRSELRLITCGGAFDSSTGHYLDNVVAFAHLVG